MVRFRSLCTSEGDYSEDRFSSLVVDNVLSEKRDSKLDITHDC